MDTHEENCEKIFQRSCEVLKLKGFTFKPKVIKEGDGYARNYKLGYTNLKSKLVVVDIYTQKLKKPKKYSSILAVIAHELAHHQKDHIVNFINSAIAHSSSLFLSTYNSPSLIRSLFNFISY